MTTLSQLIDAYVASREVDAAAQSRLAFWNQELGAMAIEAITEEAVDAALVRLAERGRLVGRRGKPSLAVGKPLSGGSLNRFVSQLAGLYRYAKRLRLLRRSFVPPTNGVEKAPEPVDPDKYLRPEEVERLLKVARVIDRRWGKLCALILVAFHTGLRRGDLLALRWADVDLERRTLTVLETKNGRPMIAALSERAAAELAKLPRPHKHALVFCGWRSDTRAYSFRKLWERVCEEAGLPGRVFHELRHGCGSALAARGINQAQIMAIMGHRTLTASARYMHHSTEDKRAVVDRVFG